jgi:NAD(P)-dependent dehydrogenase (short-subunit alcohol dehydrogenase family)
LGKASSVGYVFKACAKGSDYRYAALRINDWNGTDTMGYSAFDLTGKVVLVTGGNRGIGFGMAKAIAEAGGDVAIWGTNAEKTAAACAQLSADGGNVIGAQVDVSDAAAVDHEMDRLIAQCGRVDAVFANAGIGRPAASFLDIKDADWRRVMDVNLDGVYFTLRAAARHMKARAEAGDAGGSLVGVASLAAIEGAAANQHYAATKGAVVSMIKSVAVEFARYGIRANAVLPGWIATDMTERHQQNDRFVAKVLPRVPIRRWGEPDDFGGMAVYLASDASRYHTGTTNIIDGGYSVF